MDCVREGRRANCAGAITKSAVTSTLFDGGRREDLYRGSLRIVKPSSLILVIVVVVVVPSRVCTTLLYVHFLYVAGAGRR